MTLRIIGCKDMPAEAKEDSNRDQNLATSETETDSNTSSVQESEVEDRLEISS